jgi:hypothetical protein
MIIVHTIKSFLVQQLAVLSAGFQDERNKPVSCPNCADP